MNVFDIKDKVVVISGATGVLGGAVANYLAAQGCKVAVIGRTAAKVEAKEKELLQINPNSMGVVADVTSKEALESAARKILSTWGTIDVLINAAGGNMPGATIGPNDSIFDLQMPDFDQVIQLNLNGTVLPTIVFGKIMAEQNKGNIINFSSVSADRTLTRVMGYSAAKAAVENFTKWMATELALRISPEIRVNAVAPGFFLAEQNRKLLLNDDGSYTQRGQTIINNTPMKRFGKSEELYGAIHWLMSDAASFVTGTSVLVDGGFSAFSGV